MKTNQNVLNCEFEVEEKRQKVADIKNMVADFTSMAQDLDRQIRMEEQKCGTTDVNHFSYPPFAKAAVQRRDNLLSSVKELELQLERSMSEVEEAEAELEKLMAAANRTKNSSKNAAKQYREQENLTSVYEI